MAELETFVGLARVDTRVVLRADFDPSEPLLQLGRAVQGRTAALDLLLGL